MENMFYLFTSFLSCIVVMGLLFQFMNDRYEKAYDSSKLYVAAWIVAAILVALANQLRIVMVNVVANGIAYGSVSLILYKDREDRKYWRLLETMCLYMIIGLVEGIGVYGLDYLLSLIGYLPENEIMQASFEKYFQRLCCFFSIMWYCKKSGRRNCAGIRHSFYFI